jgi:hypothetical protein
VLAPTPRRGLIPDRVGGLREQNDSYGLATILKSHVEIARRGGLRLPAKSGQQRFQEIDDRMCCES